METASEAIMIIKSTEELVSDIGFGGVSVQTPVVAYVASAVTTYLNRYNAAQMRNISIQLLVIKCKDFLAI